MARKDILRKLANILPAADAESANLALDSLREFESYTANRDALLSACRAIDRAAANLEAQILEGSRRPLSREWEAAVADVRSALAQAEKNQ